MLLSVTELRHYVVHGTDGDVGRVRDLYLDDQRWVVRHLVVETGHWLPGREVLIPPLAVRETDPSRRTLRVGLTRSEIEASPTIDTDKPVSRQQDVELYSHFGLPGVSLDWFDPALRDDAPTGDTPADPHLRSAREVTGYHVQALGGEVGRVEDFHVEQPGWVIRRLLVRWGHWEWTRHALVSTDLVTRVSGEDRAIHVNLPRSVILADAV